MIDIKAPPSITVAVVEDEALIRMVIVESFSDEGFDVLEARDAEEALGVLRSDPTRVGVLFTDVHMPGAMDGFALARYVSRH